MDRQCDNRSGAADTSSDDRIDDWLTRLALTVDLVIFTIKDESLSVLLIRRAIEPFKDRWALPGGFVREGESLEQTAARELEEETGVTDIYLEQLYTFGEPNRDPRTRVVTVVYFALISSDDRQLRATTDAEEAQWFDVSALPELAFDHRTILDYALLRLRYKLEYTTVGFQLLPTEFTLTELQTVYEIILGRSLDKRNFRKKMLSLNILSETGRTKMSGVHRPAKLYTFSEVRFEYLDGKGVVFPF